MGVAQLLFSTLGLSSLPKEESRQPHGAVGSRHIARRPGPPTFTFTYIFGCHVRGLSFTRDPDLDKDGHQTGGQLQRLLERVEDCAKDEQDQSMAATGSPRADILPETIQHQDNTSVLPGPQDYTSISKALDTAVRNNRQPQGIHSLALGPQCHPQTCAGTRRKRAEAPRRSCAA